MYMPPDTEEQRHEAYSWGSPQNPPIDCESVFWRLSFEFFVFQHEEAREIGHKGKNMCTEYQHNDSTTVTPLR